MKQAILLALGLSLINPNTIFAQEEVSSVISDVAIGGFLDDAESTVNGILNEGKRVGDDLIISSANSLLLVINQFRAAYGSALENTFDELEDQQKIAFNEIRRATEALQLPELTDQFNTSVTVAARSVWGSDRTPLVLRYDSEVGLVPNPQTIVSLSGFSFEQGELKLSSPSLEIETLSNTGTTIEFEARQNNIDASNDWLTTHLVQADFSYYRCWYCFLTTEVSYQVHARFIDPTRITVRAVYNYTEDEPEYGPIQRKEKRQRRVGHYWNHRLDYVPPTDTYIDVESFEVTKWWEHSECSNGNTDHVVEGVTERAIRVFMYGEEQGGINRDCGAHLIYQFRTFTLNEAARVGRSDPLPISGREYRFELPHLDNATFSHFEITDDEGNIFSISRDSSPWNFLNAVPSDGRAFLLTVN